MADTDTDAHAASPQIISHLSPVRYVVIWAVLMMLTVLTVLAHEVQMGAANVIVAMAIAVAKATLVSLFFMHLWDTEGVNRMVFVVSVAFVSLLAIGVVSDFATRLPAALPPGVTVPLPPVAKPAH